MAMDFSLSDNQRILKSAVYLMKGMKERMTKKLGMLAINTRV
jgi:hypothetical protein